MSDGQGAPALRHSGIGMDSQREQRSEEPLGGTPHTLAIRLRSSVFPGAASPETNLLLLLLSHFSRV